MLNEKNTAYREGRMTRDERLLVCRESVVRAERSDAFHCILLYSYIVLLFKKIFFGIQSFFEEKIKTSAKTVKAAIKNDTLFRGYKWNLKV